MRNLRKIGTTALMALAMTLILSVTVNAKNSPAGEPISKEKKELIEIEKLIAEIQLEDELTAIEKELESEGVLNCGQETIIKILDAEGATIYEGSYSGMSIKDKELKHEVERADFLVNVDNTAYYMVF